MSTFNAPVVTKIWDSERIVRILITGQYTTAANASNTLVLQSNSVNGANNSLSCVVDVMGIDFHGAIANGFLSFEYYAPGGNNTALVIGKRGTGTLPGPFGNPLASNGAALAANVQGDINLRTTALDANDCFTVILTCRKNDANNYAFANVDAPYYAQ